MSTFKAFPEWLVEMVDHQTGEIEVRTKGGEVVMTVQNYRSEKEIERLVECWNALRKIAFPEAHMSATDDYLRRLEQTRKEAFAMAGKACPPAHISGEVEA